MPPAAVEDLQQGGRDAEERHDDAGDAKVGDVHVARVAVLLAACEFKNRFKHMLESIAWE